MTITQSTHVINRSNRETYLPCTLYTAANSRPKSDHPHPTIGFYNIAMSRPILRTSIALSTKCLRHVSRCLFLSIRDATKSRSTSQLPVLVPMEYLFPLITSIDRYQYRCCVVYLIITCKLDKNRISILRYCCSLFATVNP